MLQKRLYFLGYILLFGIATKKPHSNPSEFQYRYNAFVLVYKWKSNTKLFFILLKIMCSPHAAIIFNAVTQRMWYTCSVHSDTYYRANCISNVLLHTVHSLHLLHWAHAQNRNKLKSAVCVVCLQEIIFSFSKIVVMIVRSFECIF